MTVVDVHCHTFNADDLPVKGFVQHTKLHGVALGAALATVLDRIIQAVATNYSAEMARIDGILGPPSHMEAAPVPITPQTPEEFEREVDLALADLRSSDPASVDRIGQAMIEAETPGLATGGPEGIRDKVEAARRAIRWAKMFGRSRLDQVADLVRTFDDQVDLFTPLLVDLGTGLGDRAKTSNRQQMVLYEKISRLSMLGQLPGVDKAQVHFFIGFDPLRELRAGQVGEIETQLDLIETAVMRYGFVGVKLYPQMGWRPSGNEPYGPIDPAEAAQLDKIVVKLAEWAAANDVPLTAHCASSNFADPEFERHGFGGPLQWSPILTTFKSLHLNLGHFGGADEATPTDGWPWLIAAAMNTSDWLFADVGNHRVDKKQLLTEYLEMLAKMHNGAATNRVLDRLMYGSDWFMEALNPQPDQFLDTYRNAFQQAFGDAATAAFMGGNALHFLGFDNPDNRNNQRLRARYARFTPGQQPSWLAG